MINKYIIIALCYQILKLQGNTQLKSKYLFLLLIPFLKESFHYYPLWKRYMFSFVKTLPYIKSVLEDEVSKEVRKVKPFLLKDRYKGIDLDNIRTTLPTKGVSEKDIMETLDKVDPSELWKISGAVYTKKDKYEDIVGHIYKKFSLLSPTHPDLWPYLNQMRAEVYSMCCNLFYGKEDCCAVFTAGGTLSIIQALYAYREWGKDVKGITNPNIIVPSTAHASFRKGCQILNINLIMVDVDYISNKVDSRKIDKAINSNTVMVVGSAPSFPCGIIDPLNEIGKIANKYKIGFHVDACLGGFQLPFLEKTGLCVEETFDFRNPNITSISADLHKFGKVPKGASILMFSNKSLRDYLTYVDLQWSGGVYVTPGFPGSESGATIIAAWTIMLMTGEDTYAQVTKDAVVLCRNMIYEINKLEDVYIVGQPKLSTFAIESNTLNIHFISKKMHEKGWELNSLPKGLHFCMGELQTSRPNCISEFISDLRASISYVKDHPKENPGDMARIYCSTQQVPQFADSMLENIGRLYVDIQTSNEVKT